MAIEIREELAKELIERANDSGGTLGVEVLELECKKFLANKPKLIDGA